MSASLPVDLVISDSSKVVTGPISGYDIETEKKKPVSALKHTIGSVLTATQLASLIGYLRLLGKASLETESTVPKLLFAANLIEYCKSTQSLLLMKMSLTDCSSAEYRRSLRVLHRPTSLPARCSP